MKHLLIAALLLPSVAMPSFAQSGDLNAQASQKTLNSPESCKSYLGTTVAAMTFEQAVASLKRITPKGEFETNSAYSERLIASGNSKKIIISAPINKQYLKYNADKAIFEINRNTFEFSFGIDFARFFEKNHGYLYGDKLFNDAVYISSSEKTTGHYYGLNAFGVKSKITNITRTSKAIFQNKIDVSPQRGFERLFYFDSGYYGKSVFINVPVEFASNFKNKSTAAFVVVPKAPFLEVGSYQEDQPTLEYPYNVKVNGTVLIADIRCALIMDPDNKVVAAYLTR